MGEVNFYMGLPSWESTEKYTALSINFRSAKEAKMFLLPIGIKVLKTQERFLVKEMSRGWEWW